MIIAIDGPAGSGKSTAARVLAARLGFRHIDSGAMYRAVAWKALQLSVDFEDEEELTRLSQETEIDFRTEGSQMLVLCDGQDVTEAIRSREMGPFASIVSLSPGVRVALVAQQRRLGREGSVVMDGRDIGTVVFPDADAKFYLEATQEERARRRYQELSNSGSVVEEAQVLEEIKYRDQRDRTRSLSPLTVAEDAEVIDTTNLTVEEAVERMVQRVREKLARKDT